MDPAAQNEKRHRSFRRSRREAIVAGAIWLVFAVWTVGVSYEMGYLHNDYSTLLGIPSWIVWGLLLPWTAAFVVNSVFAFWYLRGDDGDRA